MSYLCFVSVCFQVLTKVNNGVAHARLDLEKALKTNKNVRNLSERISLAFLMSDLGILHSTDNQNKIAIGFKAEFHTWEWLDVAQEECGFYDV